MNFNGPYPHLSPCRALFDSEFTMPSIAGYVDALSDLEKKGWSTGAYYSSLEDFHLDLVCRTLGQIFAPFASTGKSDESGKALEGPKGPATTDWDSHDVDRVPSGTSVVLDIEEDAEASGPSKGELSEEAHLFAKFTCTYKIEDFLKHEGSGNSIPTFPQTDIVQLFELQCGAPPHSSQGSLQPSTLCSQKAGQLV